MRNYNVFRIVHALPPVNAYVKTVRGLISDVT